MTRHAFIGFEEIKDQNFSKLVFDSALFPHAGDWMRIQNNKGHNISFLFEVDFNDQTAVDRQFMKVMLQRTALMFGKMHCDSRIWEYEGEVYANNSLLDEILTSTDLWQTLKCAAENF